VKKKAYHQIGETKEAQVLNIFFHQQMLLIFLEGILSFPEYVLIRVIYLSESTRAHCIFSFKKKYFRNAFLTIRNLPEM
jgi:hypothetical protein